jgi:hypothetical protein
MVYVVEVCRPVEENQNGTEFHPPDPALKLHGVPLLMMGRGTVRNM